MRRYLYCNSFVLLNLNIDNKVKAVGTQLFEGTDDGALGYHMRLILLLLFVLFAGWFFVFFFLPHELEPVGFDYVKLC